MSCRQKKCYWMVSSYIFRGKSEEAIRINLHGVKVFRRATQHKCTVLQQWIDDVIDSTRTQCHNIMIWPLSISILPSHGREMLSAGWRYLKALGNSWPSFHEVFGLTPSLALMCTSTQYYCSVESPSIIMEMSLSISRILPTISYTKFKPVFIYFFSGMKVNTQV